MESQYRYPGARPFEAEQKFLFFGRENDLEDLYRLISLEQLIVLHSKSGLGKSSLINAGIVPKSIEHGRFDILRIRFGAWQKEKQETPLQILLNRLKELHLDPNLFTRLPNDNQSIWSTIKMHQLYSKGTKGLILIFDQFEELFTFPKNEIVDFRRELSEALYVSLPEHYVSVLESQMTDENHGISELELNILQSLPLLRILFAIRSDRMHLLDQLSDYLPNILKKCYELSALSAVQATRAIRFPALENAPNLRTSPFDYAQETLDRMLDYLTNEGQQRIESFQLQVLCQAIEKKVSYAGQIIQVDDLGDMVAIYENYYEDQLKLIQDEGDRKAAHLLIEEGLILEEEERRLSLYEGQIYRSYSISPLALSLLVDCHLLRSEPSVQGKGFMYELSHDTLVGPVLNAKTRRRELEKQVKEAEEQAQRFQELAEMRQKAELERQRAEREHVLREKAEALQQESEKQRQIAVQRRKRAATLTMFSILSLAVALFFFINAQKNEHLALANAKLAEENLKQMLSEQAQKDRKDYDVYLQRGDELLATGYPEPARKLFERAKLLVNKHVKDENFKDKEQEVDLRIAACRD